MQKDADDLNSAKVQTTHMMICVHNMQTDPLCVYMCSCLCVCVCVRARTCVCFAGYHYVDRICVRHHLVLRDDDGALQAVCILELRHGHQERLSAPDEWMLAMYCGGRICLHTYMHTQGEGSGWLREYDMILVSPNRM